MMGHVARNGRKHEGKRLRRIHRCKWEDDTKPVIRSVECGSVECVQQIQDVNGWQVFVNTLMELRIIKEVGNFLTIQTNVSF